VLAAQEVPELTYQPEDKLIHPQANDSQCNKHKQIEGVITYTAVKHKLFAIAFITPRGAIPRDKLPQLSKRVLKE
jgi:hypothetical protein